MDSVINPAPPVEVPTPAPAPTPIPEIQSPTPAPAPLPEQKKGFLTPEKMEIAQMVVLGAIFASFIVQIYYYRKKALEESDFVKFEERIKNLENKVLE